MLEFDQKSIERLNNPKTKLEDKLYLLSRFIEVKNSIGVQPNYWEDKFREMEEKEKVFYKTWLWLNYTEWENLVMPIPEAELVFGKERTVALKEYLKAELNENKAIDEFYKLDGKAGDILFEWAIRNLETNYTES